MTTDLYTNISLTGTVATLLNRDAMLSASVSAGTTILPIGDSYMDRGTDTVFVFPTGTTLSIGTESVTVSSIPSTVSVAISSPLEHDYPIYTPCLRTDYFDVASNIGTVTTSTSTVLSVDWGFATVFGESGTATGQMQSPYGIALDTNGNIYVADGANNRVQVFDPSLSYVTSWGTEGLWTVGETEPDPGYFFRPQDIAVSSSGTVYVTDLNRRVQAFATDGSFVTKWGEYGSDEGQFIYPLGITLGSDGNVIVCDGQNGRLQVFTPSGEFVSVWGSYGSEEGQFDFPAAVSVASTGDVYVADYNHRISVLSASGAFKFAWGVYGSAHGEFGDPEGVVVDANGYVYVSELENNRIQVFTATGEYVSDYGIYGSGEGEFDGPNQIDITPTGRLYVTDPGNDRIQVIDTDVGFATLRTIRVGMEEVVSMSIDTATDRVRFYIYQRGENAYPHTEWAPVTDAAFSVNNPATDSEIGRWGVIEAVDYHHGALDQNTLDLHALEKLMDATRPEYGRVEMTGMDVWQDAYYENTKDITYYVDTPTAFATVQFEIHTTIGTDTASKVYIGDTIKDTWWDIRFATCPTSTSTTTGTIVTEFPSFSLTAVSTLDNSYDTETEPYTETWCAGLVGSTVYFGAGYGNVDNYPGFYKLDQGVATRVASTPVEYSYIMGGGTVNGVMYVADDYGFVYGFDGNVVTPSTIAATVADGLGLYFTGAVQGDGCVWLVTSGNSSNIAKAYKFDGSSVEPWSGSVAQSWGLPRYITAPCADGDDFYCCMCTYAARNTTNWIMGVASIPVGYGDIKCGAVYNGNYYVFTGNLSNTYMWDGDSVTQPFALESFATTIYPYGALSRGGCLYIVGNGDGPGTGGSYNESAVVIGWNGTNWWKSHQYDYYDGDEYRSCYTGLFIGGGSLYPFGYNSDYYFIHSFELDTTPRTTSTPTTITVTTEYATTLQTHYLTRFGTQSATACLKIKDPATGSATLYMYYGSPLAIDCELEEYPTGFTVATFGAWGETSTGTFDIGDRGFATVREGDLVTIVELDGATRDYRVSGMIYDQRAGKLTMEIGKPQEYALTDLVKPFRTRDIISTQNL